MEITKEAPNENSPQIFPHGIFKDAKRRTDANTRRFLIFNLGKKAIKLDEVVKKDFVWIENENLLLLTKVFIFAGLMR